MRRVMLLLMVCGLLGIVQADLAITNGDFETDAPAANITNAVDWFDTISATPANWWEATWYGPTVSPNGTSVLGLSYMFTTANWAYQSVGTNNGVSSVEISFDVGSFTDAGSTRDLGVTVSVYESDGTFVAADGTDVDGAAGITLIDSVSVVNTLDPSEMIGESVILDLSAAGSGELFLRFINYAGATGEPWTAIDNIQLSTLDAVTLHDPENGETGVAVDLSDRTIANNLSWTAPSDPNIAEIKGYDIYLDPNDVKVSNRDGDCLIADNTAAGVTQYDPASDFDYSETYYWVVDTRYTRDDDPNLGTVNEIIYVGSPSSPWNFETIGAAPVIADFNNVTATDSLLPVTLEAHVTDATGDLTTAVFTLLTDDVDFPAGATFSEVSSDVSDPYNPSITVTTDGATDGYFKVLLTVTDEQGQTDEQIAEIALFTDDPNAPCDARQWMWTWTGGTFNTMDFDQDCDVDLADFAEFIAAPWLDDIGLTSPEGYVNENIPYTPVVNGLPNGNFETGDFSGFWTSEQPVITDVDPIEGSYSAEWAVDTGDGDPDGDGVAVYFTVEADTSYTVSVQITGGSNNTGDEFLVRRQYELGNPVAEATWTPTTPPTVQTVTIPFTTGPDDEGATWEFIIFGKTNGVYYKVDDFRLF